MSVRLRAACRYTTPCICAETPSRLGCEVTRRLTADIRRAKTRGLEELPVSPQVAKASLQKNLHAYIRIEGRVVTSPRFMQPETKMESSPTVREEKRMHRTKARTTSCEMQLFIVWMVARISEKETGRKAMSLPRTLRCLYQSRTGPHRAYHEFFGDWLESKECFQLYLPACDTVGLRWTGKAHKREDKNGNSLIEALQEVLNT